MSILRIQQLTLADGKALHLSAGSIVVFVGPNNSGKSAALKAVSSLVGGPEQQQKSALRAAALELGATVDELLQYMKPYRQSHNEGYYLTDKGSFPASLFSTYWAGHGVGPLAPAMISLLSTEARLSDCQPPTNIDLATDQPKHPFQRMLADRILENETSAIVRKAFGADLVIDRGAGGVIPAYIGQRPILEPPEERIDLSYALKVRSLAKLSEQGDGVRSFVSIIARALTEARPILIIDEPEAFLHPPQARLVARELASRGHARQTFIATHSSDVLQGLLSSENTSRISVVRLTRSNENATAISLDAEQIQELWKDPILRFSNILDGLFHRGVVITESDADCRFYEALLDIEAASEASADLHFAYSGGKDRIHVVVKALVNLGLPVAIVVDFDALNDEAVLRRIYEAAGGEWSSIEADWSTVKAAIESRSAFLGADEFSKEVRAQLGSCKPGEPVPRDVLQRVRKLTRQASPWDHCKSVGLAAVSSGAPNQAALRLIESLKLVGVFVVPVGEMEGFKRSIGGHGPRWVEEVMKCDLKADPELAFARCFAREILTYFPRL